MTSAFCLSFSTERIRYIDHVIEVSRDAPEFRRYVVVDRWRHFEVVSTDLQVHGVAPFTGSCVN